MNELDASSLLAIFSHLKKPADLLHAAQASTALATVCRAQSLWQQLLEEKFDIIVSAPPALTPEQVSQAAAETSTPAAGGEVALPHAAETTAPQDVLPGLVIAAAAAAAAGPNRQLDLQATFKALATRPPPGALRFAAVFTDGGCDGMKDKDLTYWADHAFQPNHWNPHCSDGKSNINIIGLLHPHGVSGDEELSRHRAYLVERCAAAAAVLFSPPQAPHQTREQAAASLSTWSTTGQERLFMDLYQDLWLHQQDSTWGRLLLSGVPQPEWPQEFERMADTAEAIQSNVRQNTYKHVDTVPLQEVEAAAAAAVAAAAVAGSSIQTRADFSDLRASSQRAVLCMSPPPPPAAAAAQGGASNSSSSQWQLPHQQKAGLQKEQAHQQQVLQRHMVDKEVLPWFSSPEMTQTTGVIEEIIVSRVGHFTCPVAAGAVLLGQHPTVSSSSGGSGSSGSTAESAQLQAVLRVKHDPMVTALDDATDFDQVKQAVSAGLLPEVVQYTVSPGWCWCEFAPLSKDLRQQRQQQGLYMRPIVWFRFTTPQPLAAAEPAVAQGAAEEAQPAAPAEQGAQAAADAAAGQQAAAATPAAVVADSGDMEGIEEELAVEPTEVGSDTAGSSDDYMSEDDDDDGITLSLELPPAGYTPSPAAAAASAAAAAADEQMMPDVEGLQVAFANAGGGFGAEFAESYGELPPGVVPPVAAVSHTQQQHPQQQQQQQRVVDSSSSSSSQKAPWQQRGVPGVSAVLSSPASVHEIEHSNAAPHMLLRMPLSVGPCSGNVAVLKLISCEDKMDEYEDPSEEPNIDVQYVALRGVAVTLDRATGLQLL